MSRGPWGCCHSFDHTHSACGVKGDPHVQSEDEQQAEMTRLTMKTTLGDLRCDSEDESSEPLWEARPITIMKPYIRSSVVMFGVCMMENKIFLYPLILKYYSKRSSFFCLSVWSEARLVCDAAASQKCKRKLSFCGWWSLLFMTLQTQWNYETLLPTLQHYST